MNLQPVKADAIHGLSVHAFRQYPEGNLPDHIDADRTHLNKLLCGRQEALDNLPTHQPDTGRKIRSDANRIASMICTLPKELDPNEPEHVQQWAKTTTEWLQNNCPGTVAWAVLHMDETRPHIHAAVIPENADKHLSYKAYFGAPAKLRNLQNSYAHALDPLGVKSHSELEKAARKPGYTKGIHGWRVGRAVLDAQDQVWHAQQRVLNLQAEHPEKQLGTPKPFTSAKRVKQQAEALLHAKDLHIRVLEDQNQQMLGQLHRAEQREHSMENHNQDLRRSLDHAHTEIKALQEVIRSVMRALPDKVRQLTRNVLDTTRERLGLSKQQVLGQERGRDRGLDLGF